MATEPKSLQEAIVYFANPDNCLSYLVARRWPKGVVCPTCGSKNVSFVPSRRLWQCKTRHPKSQFSVKVGTIFEDSPLGLNKWLPTVWMITNCKNGVSSWEIHRAIGVTQKTAWFMLHRIRLALRVGVFHKLGGGPSGENEVEVDETFVGGRVQNMHKDRRLKLHQLRNEVNRPDHYMGKTVVMGMLDRTLREVRARVIPAVRREVLQAEIMRQVKLGSKVYAISTLATWACPTSTRMRS